MCVNYCFKRYILYHLVLLSLPLYVAGEKQWIKKSLVQFIKNSVSIALCHIFLSNIYSGCNIIQRVFEFLEFLTHLLVKQLFLFDRVIIFVYLNIIKMCFYRQLCAFPGCEIARSSWKEGNIFVFKLFIEV